MCVCVCVCVCVLLTLVRSDLYERDGQTQTELILFSSGESAVVHVLPPFCFFRLLTVGKYTLTRRTDKLKKVNAYHCFRHTAVGGGGGGGGKRHTTCFPAGPCMYVARGVMNHKTHTKWGGGGGGLSLRLTLSPEDLEAVEQC